MNLSRANHIKHFFFLYPQVFVSNACIMNQQNHAFEILGENWHERWENSSNNGIYKMINNLSTLLSNGEVLVAFLVQSWVIHFTCDIGVSPEKNNQNHI